MTAARACGRARKARSVRPGRDAFYGKGNPMIFDRLTWIGFMIVAAGWALLLTAPALNEAAAHLSGRAPEAAPLVNVPAIAQSAILSGFGVSIIGALQTGFGALDRFFVAVLARSGQARAQTPPSAAAYPAAQSPAPAANYRAAPPAAPPARAIARQQPAQLRKILERGWVKDRAYVLFVDGSVEVETMLGRRTFPSLQEAQEFIA
jgi:prepilin-type processing-associated H-X9-DG protein